MTKCFLLFCLPALTACTPYSLLVDFRNDCAYPIHVTVHGYYRTYSNVLEEWLERDEHLLLLSATSYDEKPGTVIWDGYRLEIKANGKQRDLDTAQFIEILGRVTDIYEYENARIWTIGDPSLCPN